MDQPRPFLRDPQSGKFMKGTAPGPGRPYGSLLRFLVPELLRIEYPDIEPNGQIIAKRMVQMAKDGHPDMIKFVWEQVEGRAPLAVEHSGEVKKNVTVRFVISNRQLSPPSESPDEEPPQEDTDNPDTLADIVEGEYEDITQDVNTEDKPS